MTARPSRPSVSLAEALQRFSQVVNCQVQKGGMATEEA